MKQYLSYGILCLVVIAGGWYIHTHWETFQDFKNLNLQVLFPLFALHIVYLYCKGLVFKVIVGR
ncbi:MAG: hypothetical protein JXN60_02185, partial [Lentisphaerae bacterium]|nr:hypothetical protein [Lentisphaerota bacterium]